MAAPEQDTDPRWVLARERTTLAWARLSLVCSLVAIFLAGWTPPAWVPTAVVAVLGVAAGGGGLVAALLAHPSASRASSRARRASSRSPESR